MNEWKYLSFLLYWAFVREVSKKLYLSYEFFSYDRYSDMETRLYCVRIWPQISSELVNEINSVLELSNCFSQGVRGYCEMLLSKVDSTKYQLGCMTLEVAYGLC